MCHMGMGQNGYHQGTAGLVLVSFSRVPFWDYPIFDPHPHYARKSLQGQKVIASLVRPGWAESSARPTKVASPPGKSL